MLHIVLIEPEIPPNTGNIARLCLAAGARLHLVGELGFSLDEKSLKRAGMDYWHLCDIHRWESLLALQSTNQSGRFFYFSTKARKTFWEEAFTDGDFFVFGRESRGLPESLLHANPDQVLRIPMTPEARSLNLATSVGIALYEGVRQVKLSF
ncbi:MAG: tRNA (cytidine(34)-2'-O)-methyltransferase [Verrucomicrobia bacterium]|nr:tRNA (cytidine(34)-2'-O)-methyltransferase [Verrucomicrobiota bacterium]